MIAGLVCYAALPAEPETWALAGAGCVVIGLSIALRNAAWAAWLWLALAFIAIVFWAFRPANKRRFERDAEIPLKDDHPEP